MYKHNKFMKKLYEFNFFSFDYCKRVEPVPGGIIKFVSLADLILCPPSTVTWNAGELIDEIPVISSY